MNTTSGKTIKFTITPEDKESILSLIAKLPKYHVGKEFLETCYSVLTQAEQTFEEVSEGTSLGGTTINIFCSDYTFEFFNTENDLFVTEGEKAIQEQIRVRFH